VSWYGRYRGERWKKGEKTISSVYKIGAEEEDGA
jgi:hypothetical protein